MSDLSLKVINERIIFDNLDIIDINELEDEINHFHNPFYIYSDKKLNSFKMYSGNIPKDSYSNKNSKYSKIDSIEQIDDVKYNVFFILQNKCKFDNNIYDDIKKGRLITAKRLVKIEISQDPMNYCAKKYVFIPREKEPCFELENKRIIRIIDGEMFLDGKKLISQKEFEKIRKEEKKSFEGDISSISSISENNLSLHSINSNCSSKKSLKKILQTMKL